ncbi:adenosylcobinamide kinase /adenosylcobinamide-phosphate guanylyltransferase [Parasphingorhabdus marina DSM 22363]|uniref:Bifunctional adenosylcobalamin biosynthesis protein n=1 Tax=Parasphingorhabdus marina DSM 22363 TaxID=1123272 RepID=A0A1N6D0M3_9SPHN|nr:bifunctional adenosylcobinamide kinase/adenosylcobinamide-phosphate guanylyltransferase [Parasphingorhabdus marina]SIN64325.1 adenosylcobinamide kinase /adenosylcobinamide-phosphate guanylyltransferase [Parasphingorhabdus marina DSM 22363]
MPAKVRTSGKITLILGGTRSGKSRFGQQLAEEYGGQMLYVATAEAFDAEMTDRINRHREDRGSNWQTIEEQMNIAHMIRDNASPGTVLLVDCLTIWLSNLMLSEADIAFELDNLSEALRKSDGPVILVSNEVGSGVVPESPLGREFRDQSGWMNQRLAREAGEVALVTAGLPLWLKGRTSQ